MDKLYEFHDGSIDYVEIMPDPTDKSVTKLMKAISITRTPGGRIAKIGFTITQPKPRDIEVSISEPLARAIVKIFDEDGAGYPKPDAED